MYIKDGPVELTINRTDSKSIGEALSRIRAITGLYLSMLQEDERQLKLELPAIEDCMVRFADGSQEKIRDQHLLDLINTSQPGVLICWENRTITHISRDAGVTWNKLA